MKLYYSPGACSLAVRIVVNEIGLQCDFESVDLKTKITATGDDFLKINSKGAVPVLVTANHEILTENVVIQQYLTDQYSATHLLSPVGDFRRYRILEWLNYVSTELHKNCSALFNPVINEELKTMLFKPILKQKIHFVDQALEKSTYLCGNEFTLPDAYLFVVLLWLKRFVIPMDQWENVSRYFVLLKTRPSIKRALAEENIQ